MTTVQTRSREALELLAAVHWRISFPFAPRARTLGESVDLLARCVGAQLRTLEEGLGSLPHDYALCSTVLSGICPQAVQSTSLVDGIAQASGYRPLVLLRAYECSNWGFALRFFCRHTDAEAVMLTLIDVDLHRSSILATDKYWGASGFGTSSLVFALPPGGDIPLTIGRADRRAGSWGSDTRAFANLAHAVKQRRDKGSVEKLFVHFMAPHIRRAMENVVGVDRLSPNRFAEYGHCFGSDPWIGIIEWLQRSPPDGRTVVAAASLANNAYYTLCDVVVSPSTKVELRLLAGDDETLTQLSAHHPPAARPQSSGPVIAER